MLNKRWILGIIFDIIWMMKFVELFLITYKVRLMEEQLWQQQAEKIQKEEKYTQENHKERMESIFKR